MQYLKSIEYILQFGCFKVHVEDLLCITYEPCKYLSHLDVNLWELVTFEDGNWAEHNDLEKKSLPCYHICITFMWVCLQLLPRGMILKRKHWCYIGTLLIFFFCGNGS